MHERHDRDVPALQLLERMFEAELDYIAADDPDPRMLASVFHPDVVVHEPASLPYAGDWRGLKGLGALFLEMKRTWREIGVAGLRAARDGDTVFMACSLTLTARATGRVITQPFAEALRFEDGRLVDGTPFYFDTQGLLEALRPG